MQSIKNFFSKLTSSNQNQNNSINLNAQQQQQLYQDLYPSSYSHGKKEKRGNYNDNDYNSQLFIDEEINPNLWLEQQKLQNQNQVQQQIFNPDKDISFNIKAKFNTLQLNSTQNQKIPAMISLKALEKSEEVQNNAKENAKETLNNRPGIDLICVIDRSGSMKGEKIKQVKETLKYILTLLNENDRLCIVTFESSAYRLTNLLKVSGQNLNTFETVIENIFAYGGTDITKGIQLALQAFNLRKYINNVSSIFLLSDGLDGGAEIKIQNLLSQQKGQLNFTIHSFGFGQDHDPELMSNIAKLKDGNFYFVEKIENVEQCFVDALGGLMSVVMQNVKIQLKKQNNPNLNSFKISKVYTDSWVKLNEDSYQININQLFAGVSKDFIFEFELQPIKTELQDHQRNINFFNASIEYESVVNNQVYKKNVELVLTVYNENEKLIEEINEDADVLINYLRVRGADVIKETIIKADQNKNEEGQKLIDEMLNEINQQKKLDKSKLNMLVNDLKQTKVSCEQNNYQNQGGKHKMMECMNANYYQKSRGLDEGMDLYSNQVQQKLVSITKMRKK